MELSELPAACSASQGFSVCVFTALRCVYSVYSCCHKLTVDAGFEEVDGFRTHHFCREVVPMAYDSVGEEAPTNVCVASLRLNWQAVVSGS